VVTPVIAPINTLVGAGKQPLRFLWVDSQGPDLGIRRQSIGYALPAFFAFRPTVQAALAYIIAFTG
jgi:hypothetical protein